MKKDSVIKRIAPGLVLLFMGPLLGELVSGHQAPLQFADPFNFLLTALPYGLGALVCRELTVIWGKGKTSLVLMGIAFGLFEEIVVIRSIINSNWSELGAIGLYNFWGGVNWTYGLMLVHFHITISIVSSVLLTEAIFPKRQNKRWLSNPMLAICGVGLALWIPAGFYMTAGIPSVPLYVLGVLTMFLFVFAAYKIPSKPYRKTGRRTAHPIVFFILGLINMTVIFLGTFYEGPKPSLVVLFTALLLADIICFILLLQWSQKGYGWTDRHKIALTSGFLMFFIALTAIKDFEGSFAGYSVVSAVSVILLVVLYGLTKRRETLAAAAIDAGDKA